LAVAKTARKSRKKKVRRPAPTPPPPPPRSRGRVALWLPLVLVAASAVVVALLLGRDDGPPSSSAPAGTTAAAGLPATPDYHSLLVSPEDAERLFLGTHAGLFETRDGGRSWKQASLVDRDAMNLARTTARTIWAAGHGVLAKSTDGGVSWEEVEPPGLPHLDVHGFAADPSNPDRLYAAIAGEGLYRSVDGGASYSLVSTEVGPAVFGLAVTPDGAILAGDTQKGLFTSSDGGKSWKEVLKEPALGIAVNPQRPEIVLAAGPPGIFRSRDEGATWERVLALAEGAGPLAWSPSEPETAFAVGFDRTLYRTGDQGATWQPVT
jgi:photosystem II stability/assembly factor-like uncharacterized protein